MSQPSSESPSTRSLGRVVVAALILLVVGYFLVHFLLGLVIAVAGFAVVVLILGAVLWALRVLL